MASLQMNSGYVPALGEQGKPASKVPDRIVDRLLQRIFSGDLKPGDRLPPLRDLSVQMDVDRTSLRIALERLNQMKLVSMVQGSCVVIKDYREEAGLSFLRAVFSIDAPQDESAKSRILLQLMEFMTLLAPGMVGIASQRATPLQIEEMLKVYRSQLQHLDDPDTLAELRTLTEDILADITGNLVLKMIYNSTRPLRKELNRRIVDTLDVRENLEKHLEWIRQFLAGGIRREDVETMYRRFQNESVAAARQTLLDSI